MAYTVQAHLPCTDCGEPTNRRVRRRREPLCLECALKHMSTQTEDLAARKGEHFANWQRSMVRYAERLQQSTMDGPPSTME